MHTSAAGTACEPTPAVAPISVRVSRGSDREREADWNPEQYYTAQGPVYRTARGGKAGGPSAELVGMLPLRDRGFKGITGGAANVTVEVVAPVATLERAAAAIAMSCLRQNEAFIGSTAMLVPAASADCEVHTVNAVPSTSKRAKGRLSDRKSKVQKHSRTKQRCMMRADDENAQKVNKANANACDHKKVPKQVTVKPAKARKRTLAAAATAHACTLRTGEAARAFAFEVVAAAVAMHEERDALVGVLGQAETLDLCHTPCISALSPGLLTIDVPSGMCFSACIRRRALQRSACVFTVVLLGLNTLIVLYAPWLAVIRGTWCLLCVQPGSWYTWLCPTSVNHVYLNIQVPC